MIATNGGLPPRLTNVSLLAETFALYRRGFKTFVGIAAVVEVPIAIASFVVWFTPEAYGFGFPLVLVWVVAFILESAAICEAAAALYENRPLGIGGAYLHAAQRGWALLRLVLLALVFALVVTTIMDWLLQGPLYAFMRTISLFLDDGVSRTLSSVAYQCVRFAVVNFWMAPVALALPVLIIERRPSARAALKRSYVLVRGVWWRTGVQVLALAMLSSWIPWFTGWAIAVLTGMFPTVASPDGLARSLRPAPESLFVTALSLLLGPILLLGLTLLYYDRRSRVAAEPHRVRGHSIRKPGLAPPPPGGSGRSRRLGGGRRRPGGPRRAGG